MFCSECGKPAQGKFCCHCGTPLTLAIAMVEPATELAPVELVPDWENEVRYETILKFPGVQAKIERHASQAPRRMSGEKFLSIANKVVDIGVPMEGVAVAAQALWSHLGIKTGKERSQQVAAPAGQVLVRALCSLARHGQPLRCVTQANDGCLLEAALPSDLFSLEGDLLVSVRRAGKQAQVHAATQIAGQLMDWGKSNRSLDQLFHDLVRDAA